MLAFSALVAGSFSLGAQVADEIAPSAIMAARFALAGLILGCVALANGGIPRPSTRAPWRYLILGGLFAAYFVMMFEGLKTAPAISAAAVFTLSPILSGLFGYLIMRQIMTRQMAFALAVGAAGAVWVVFRGDWALAKSLQIGKGEIIYFVGCIAHAVYIPMIARLNRGERPDVFAFWTLVAGCLLLVLYGWSDILSTDWTALRPLVWITLGYIAIFASAATFVLLQFASLRLPAAKVMAYTYLTPSWVILWEMATGHGHPPSIVLVGIALTVLALLMLLEQEDTTVSDKTISPSPRP